MTVGIITKNEETHIKETINSILKSNYPKNKYEIVIVDGNSKDRTQEIINKLMKNNKNIRLIKEPWKKGSHGLARNLLADNARGEYLAFTDADCIVEKSWLKSLINAIIKERKLNSKVVAVGGIRKPVKSFNWKENLINNLMATFFGSGGSQGFVKTKKKYTDSIPNYNSIYIVNIIKKERYSTMGVGEDYEFNLRLNKLGYKIAFNKDAIIYHHQEESFGKFLRQVYRYGKAQVKIYKKIKRIRFFAIISPLFVLGLIAGLILSFFNEVILKLYISIIFLYLFMDLFYSIGILLKTKKIYNLFAIILYPLEHISYGLGVLRELIR